jgi:2-desacetyl-2-hydroxyethyl bacteriochlorophyllide A dehydrogenase
MKKVFLQEPGKIVEEEMLLPEPAPGWVVIKSQRCGICGTDVHSYFGETIFGPVFPFNIGHEVSGIITSVGDDVNHLSEGDHVVINPFFTCDQCPSCRQGKPNNCENKTTIGLKGPGGFSEYTYVPATSAYKTDLNNFDELTLVEPLSTVIYGIRKLQLHSDSNVLLNGAGPIGMLFLQLLKHENINTLTVADLNDAKLKKALSLGANNIINPAKEDADAFYKEIVPKGFDIIIDCTGSVKAIEYAFSKLGFGGQFLLFGVSAASQTMNIKPFEIYKKDARIFGSFALDRSSFQEALHLITNGKIDTKEIISEVIELDQLEDALIRISKGLVDGKVVVNTSRS